MVSGEPCQCPDARKWRAYWTRDAIAERVSAEIDRARAATYEGYWADIDAAHAHFRDAPRPKTWHLEPYAELERRRRGG